MGKKVVLLFVLAGFVLAGVIWRVSSRKEEGTVLEPPASEKPTREAVDKEEGCEIENCHGLEIECGPNLAEICTMEYEMGDSCRQYARCGYIDGKCQPVLGEEFEKCKRCVKKCIDKFGDTVQALECEADCGGN